MMDRCCIYKHQLTQPAGIGQGCGPQRTPRGQPASGLSEESGRGPQAPPEPASLGAAPRGRMATALLAAAAPRGSGRPTWSPEGPPDRSAGRETTPHLWTLRGPQWVLLGVPGRWVSNAFIRKQLS